jgi:hypothetical protein
MSFEAAPLPGSFDADHRPFPIGDFNGDGFDDVGVYAPMSNRVYVRLTGRSGVSTTTPTLRPTNGIPVNAPVLAFAGIGDFDGDGDDDVAVLYGVIGLAHSALIYRGGDAPGAAYGPFTLPALPDRGYAIASAW